ncbi:helix-turn-helix domain-containing protein [Listeria fleischmannii]|uniref:HTH domain-containing protein n=1 Tax=Listeria fleischmannii FSL S10-1203 TaxID=1265822 RepID=W7DGD5_9LIST|nr:helix-turn-helix transcriptional regulator [Listeria fleischmannii]EUJ48697.1 HTH domain-containing protein [Listeria fleischmannii FSL S10-1203]
MFERIKNLCIENGISIKELSLSLGFGENVIYSWKQKTPGIDKLQKVADYFDVSTDYLLGRTDLKSLNNNKNELIQKFEKRPETKRFLVELSYADIESLKQLEKVWRALHDK